MGVALVPDINGILFLKFDPPLEDRIEFFEAMVGRIVFRVLILTELRFGG